MISYNEALALIVSHSQPNDTVTVPVADALCAVSAATVSSPSCTPSFDNSAMDGFAVRAEDTVGARVQAPLTFDVLGTIAAGDPPPAVASLQHTAWEIMTGAPVPSGYNAVIPVENIEITQAGHERPLKIAVKSPTEARRHIRQAGEDFKAGEVILEPGTLMQPRHLMALASVGIRNAVVYPRPKVVVICTGRELVEDNPDDAGRPGQIHNANAPFLCAMLSTMASDVHYHGAMRDDDPSSFSKGLNEILERPDPPQVILSTGAVSAGKWDFVPDVLQKIGANIIFHKALIRPGKPILFARLPNGAYFFGLPGNPISTAVGLRFFVYPLLRFIQGLSEEKPVTAKLNNGVSKKQELRCFYKAFLTVDTVGQCCVTVLDEQESFKIRSFAKANCWTVLEEGRSSYRPSEVVTVYPFCPTLWRE